MILLSSCSPSASVTAVTPAPTPQEQTPAVTEPIPVETQTTSTTPTPSESTTPSTTTTQPAPTVTESTPTVSPTVSGVTASELALHNSKADCWVVYKNEVYDVTKYLPKHPGGTLAISKHCGTLNFEKAFKGQHGTSKEKTLASNSINMGAYVG